VFDASLVRAGQRILLQQSRLIDEDSMKRPGVIKELLELIDLFL
jgi:hypothetical protein